jgi:hypothetical protein
MRKSWYLTGIALVLLFLGALCAGAATAAAAPPAAPQASALDARTLAHVLALPTGPGAAPLPPFLADGCTCGQDCENDYLNCLAGCQDQECENSCFDGYNHCLFICYRTDC